MKLCDKTCIFSFFPIINKYLFMAKRSILSELFSYNTYCFSSATMVTRTRLSITLYVLYVYCYAPQYYVIRTLRLLLHIRLEMHNAQ